MVRLHAPVQSEACKHKGVVQKFQLRAGKPILRDAARAERIDLNLKHAGALPLDKAHPRGFDFLGRQWRPRRPIELIDVHVDGVGLVGQQGPPATHRCASRESAPRRARVPPVDYGTAASRLTPTKNPEISR
jgi:hypothetical protein